MTDAVGTAKAAKWLGMDETSITRLCRKKRLKGAWQPAGYHGRWLIPIETLKAKRECPEWLKPELPDLL
jgi:hypothetical protein